MPRCLLVEDDRDNREGYAEYLRASGLEVREAPDGDAAVRAVDEQLPDIVLMDLQLPAIDGWQLIRHLRGRPAFGATPIVVISACVYPDDHARAVEAGCNAFLEKPCLPDQVLREVQRQLEEYVSRHG